MSLPEFEIEIVSQSWIPDDAEGARYDLCTHGDLRLVIGGHVILPGDGENEFTISTSALALLRTLESDHKPAPPLEGTSGSREWLNDSCVPMTEKLVMHCGMLAMLSCPNGADWSVTHLGGRVRLHDVVRVDEHGETRFPDISIELRFDEYRRSVVTFAEKAKEPFAGVEKEFDEGDYDRELYPRFWAEYDGLLARHSGS
ncbi:MAG: hypothetical protein ACRDPV_09375 [Gaiellaceae bacterium]